MVHVVTIGRQFGSAGKDIGEIIAEKTGYAFYDKELVEMAAKESNFSPQAVKKLDERASSSLLYSLASGSYSLNGVPGPLYYEMPLNDKLFIAQSEIIKRVAHAGSCVIVGRCADYALEEEEGIDTLNLFVHAPLDWRVRRVAEALKLTERQARDRVIKTDKQRKTYYNYYSNKEWGAMKNYDICINSEKMGIEKGAQMIVEYLKGLS